MLLRIARASKRPGGTWSLRKHVPKDLLLPDPNSPKELRRSLDTKNEREAKRKFREMEAEIEAGWGALRRQAGRIPAKPSKREPREKNRDENAIRLDDLQVAALAGEPTAPRRKLPHASRAAVCTRQERLREVIGRHGIHRQRGGVMRHRGSVTAVVFKRGRP